MKNEFLEEDEEQKDVPVWCNIVYIAIIYEIKRVFFLRSVVQ